MIKHIWTVVCRGSVINQDDNNISLLNILEQLEITLSPIKKLEKRPEVFNTPFSFDVVSFWVKEDNNETKINVRVELLDPHGKILATSENVGVFPQNIRRLRTRLKVNGLPVTDNGRYYINVRMKENTEKNYKVYSENPIDINLIITSPAN